MTGQWVEWWCAPWHWAHPEWKAKFATLGGLSSGDCNAVARSRHVDFLRNVGIVPSQPPEPVEALLRWLALTPKQREHAFSLVQRVCFAKPAQAPSPDLEDGWCYGLAKAIRPGQWIHPGIEDERVLLGAFVGERCWSRLQLMWAPGEPGQWVNGLPDKKLQTLWQSVLWRVALE